MQSLPLYVLRDIPENNDDQMLLLPSLPSTLPATLPTTFYALG